MPNLTPGHVLEVTTEDQGAICTAWVGTQLYVADASDFVREGGTFTLDGDPSGAVYHYTDVVEGELETDPDVVTTVEGPPALVLDSQGEFRADIWPRATETFARVQPYGQDDTIQATVPHELKPLLADGVRAPEDRESVEVVLHGTEWRVAQVVGRSAVIKTEALDPVFVGVVTSADGRARVIHREVPEDADPVPEPDEPGVNVDDTWYAHRAGTGATVGAWRWDGGTWLPFTIDGQVIANLDAGTITSGSLSGIGVFSPSPTQTPRVEIVGSSFRTVRTNPDGAEVTGISLGGADADRLQLLNPDGTVLAGFDEFGNGTASSMDVQGTLRVGGQTLEDLLFQLPRGLIARNRMALNANSNSYHFGSTELGIGEVMFDAARGRAFRVGFYGRVNALAAGKVKLRFRATFAPGYDTLPASPQVSGTATPSPEWQIASLECPSPGVYSFYLESYVSDYGGNYRVLLTAQGSDGAHGYVIAHDNWPNQFTVYDVGPYLEADDGQSNMGGGTVYQAPADPAPPPAPVVTTPPKKTYTSVWRATSVATYREGIGSMSTSQYLLQQGVYGSTKRNSHVLFGGGAVSGETGKTLASALSGATVSRIEFYGLVKQTYYGTGCTASLAPSTAGTLSDIKTATNETRVSGWKANTARWVTLANIGTGVRSVAIGPDTSSLSEYMKFDPTLSNLQLRVTYTR